MNLIFKQPSPADRSGKFTYILEIPDHKFVIHIKSESEKICKELAIKTNLISDKLMYLSELAKSIEEIV